MTANAAALFSLVLLAACGSDAATREVADVPVRTAQEEVRVGSVDGPDALTFPADAVILEDQRIFVLFPREALIRVLDERGRIVDSVGRWGSGPGEFTSPGALGLLGDSVAVYDPPRITMIPTGGGEPRTFMPIAPQLSSTEEFPLVPVGLFSERQLLLWPRIGRTGLRPNLVDSLRFRILEPGATTPSRYAALNYRNRTVMYRDPDETGPAAVFSPHPFANDDLWAMQAGGAALVIVDRSSLAGSGAVRLLLIAPSGDTVAARPVAVSPPREISESVVDSVVSERAENLLTTRGARPPNLSVGRRWVQQALGDLPEFHTPVDQLVAASDGTIWLRREEGSSPPDSQEWLRLDPQGTPIEWVTFPKEMRLLDARGEVAWGTVFDELDIPYLVRLRLGEPRESASNPGRMRSSQYARSR